MNSPTNSHCHKDLKLGSDERSSDEILTAKEEIASVLFKLKEVKSWIDDNLRESNTLDKGSENKSSIPCIIKQPKHPELKGVIKQDLGDRFVVYIPLDGSTITVSKLLVYPDFSSSVGQLGKIPPSKKISPPSKIPPTKTRRKKGDGTGYIYRRTITRKGKQYEESYYRYRDESGFLRSKYIPQKLLIKVEQAESDKKSVADILVLLGGDEISRGEQSSTLDDRKLHNSDRSNELISLSRGACPQLLGKQIITPSTKRRKQGDGAGYIECKPIKRGNKEYKQYWYHYEIWEDGDRQLKKSKYIPRQLLARVEQLEAQKVPVREILEVLKARKRVGQLP
jgi:hypothetical protein